MRIAAAEIDDHEALTRLTKLSKAYWGFPEELLLTWEHLLTISKEYIEKNKVIKLVEEGTIVGYYACFCMEETTTVKLDNLFILPGYIGTGLGKVLMDHFLIEAKNAGAEKVLLDAEPNAEGFYKKFGFVTIGQLQSSVKDRFLPIMELMLK